LEESEVRFRAVFNTASLGIILTDVSGFIQHSNNRVHSLFGHDEVDLHLQPLMDLLPDFPHELLTANDQPSPPSPAHKLRGVRKDGEGESFMLEVRHTYVYAVNQHMIVFSPLASESQSSTNKQ
jgi:PAS domain S-box-containing protein